MIKKVMVLALGTALAAAAFAASPTELSSVKDSARWDVTATKDLKAGLVVSPKGAINFKYQAKSGNFAPADAAFMINVLNNQTGAVSGSTAATEFKLEAVQTDGYAHAVSDPTQGFDVELQVNGQALSKKDAAPTLLVDSTTMGSFLASLDGLNAVGSEGNDKFSAVAVQASGSTGTMKDLPDGTFTGQATVAFKATWLG